MPSVAKRSYPTASHRKSKTITRDWSNVGDADNSQDGVPTKAVYRDRLKEALQGAGDRVKRFRELRPSPWKPHQIRFRWKGPGKENSGERSGKRRLFLLLDEDYRRSRRRAVKLLRAFVEDHVDGDTYKAQIAAVMGDLGVAQLRLGRQCHPEEEVVHKGPTPRLIHQSGMSIRHQEAILCEALGCSSRTLRKFRIKPNDEGIDCVVYRSTSGTGGSGRRSKHGQLAPEDRAKVQARDDHQCVRCGAGDDLQVHHIIPVAGETGLRPDDLHGTENLATLCKACHRAAHVGSWPEGVRLGEDLAYGNADCAKEEFWEEFWTWAQEPEQYAAWLAVRDLEDVDRSLVEELLGRFKDIDALRSADAVELTEVSGVTLSTARAVKQGLAAMPEWVERFVLMESSAPRFGDGSDG